MIVTELYNGQGLGNQLWCYVVARCIALKNGFNFGIMSPEKFRGKHLFESIDFGEQVIGGSGPEGGPPESLPSGVDRYYREKKEVHALFGCDVSRTDLNLMKVPDNTKIEGTMQSEDYILQYRENILKWLKLKPDLKNIPLLENTCLIHIRGGDFFWQTEVRLGREYYLTAMNYIRQYHGDVNFAIVTDDVKVAKEMLPEVEIISSSVISVDNYKAQHHLGGDISVDYSLINSAQYLILSNSSFAWWAAWTNNKAVSVVAPKYWARHNISDGFWSNGDSLTRKWVYLDRNHDAYTYNKCLTEKNDYEKKHYDKFVSQQGTGVLI